MVKKKIHKLQRDHKNKYFVYTYCGKITKRHLTAENWEEVTCQHCLLKRRKNDKIEEVLR